MRYYFYAMSVLVHLNWTYLGHIQIAWMLKHWFCKSKFWFKLTEWTFFTMCKKIFSIYDIIPIFCAKIATHIFIPLMCYSVEIRAAFCINLSTWYTSFLNDGTFTFRITFFFFRDSRTFMRLMKKGLSFRNRMWNFLLLKVFQEVFRIIIA